MNKVSYVLAISFCFLGTTVSHLVAQQPTPEPPPKPPLVTPLPENLSWRMTVKLIPRFQKLATPTASEALPTKVYPVDIRVDKQGMVERQKVVNSDQSQTTEYLVAESLFWKDPLSGRINLLGKGASLRMDCPFPTWGFVGLDWLKAEYFNGTVQYEGKPCHHYIERVITNPLANDEARQHYALMGDTGAREVLIDADTRLPVVSKIPIGIVYYSYPASGEPATLPPPYQAVWDHYQLQVARLNKMRMP